MLFIGNSGVAEQFSVSILIFFFLQKRYFLVAFLEGERLFFAYLLFGYYI